MGIKHVELAFKEDSKSESDVMCEPLDKPSEHRPLSSEKHVDHRADPADKIAPSSGEESAGEGANVAHSSGGSDYEVAGPRRINDGNRRANTCSGCAELRRLRRDNKRLEQELRETNNTRYHEEQRVLALLEQVDTKSREAVQLRQKVMHRSNSTFFENWFYVHLAELSFASPKRRKSRGLSWQKLYVILRGGQMLLYNVNQGRRTSYATPILTMDINCRMSIFKVQETDAEIIATNKDASKMFKIEYTEPSAMRNSFGKRSSTCEITQTLKKVVLFEASTVEEKEQWMRMLSEEIAVSGVWHRKTVSDSSVVKLKESSCQTDETETSPGASWPISAMHVLAAILAFLLAISWLKPLLLCLLRP